MKEKARWKLVVWFSIPVFLFVLAMELWPALFNAVTAIGELVYWSPWFIIPLALIIAFVVPVVRAIIKARRKD